MPFKPAVILKSSLLAFWAIWLTVVFSTNLVDAGKALGWLPASWSFASGNYGFLAVTTVRYGSPIWLNGLLFAGVICWEGLAAALFWLAWWTYRKNGASGRGILYLAFTAGLTLWAAFLIADEVFIAYPVEATHLRLFNAQLLTLLAIELLPGAAPPVERK